MTTGYLFYIKRLFSLPPHVAAKKIFDVLSTAIASRAEKIRIRLFGDDITADEFAGAIEGGVREALEKIRTMPNVFLPTADAVLPDDVLEHSPEEASEIIRAADAICGHRLDLLGSGEVFLGERIDWHRDFKSGYEWNTKKFYRDIEIPYGKGDIKVPWELSRFQHLPLLGQAYRISHDEKYTSEFIDQIMDWISRNPVKLGPNWACTMDVAIRAANWLTGWEFFRDSPAVSDFFLGEFLKSLLTHGRFIRNNLENYSGNTSNHYLSDISGLFFIAAMVPEFRESSGWLQFAKMELESEMQKQVYEDGCDFEASTCYHRLVLELFFYPALLARKTGISFSEAYLSCLKKMFQAALALMKPDGRMPQIGDNDNGRFLKFEAQATEILDMRYLLPLAAVFFDAAFFKIAFSTRIDDELPGYSLPVLWLFGREGLQRWTGMPSKASSSLANTQYAEAGWYVFRFGRDYMIVSCGPNGQNGNGGHAHNDKLSFELSLGGEDFIVDPGTCLYTPDPDARNHFRSTNSHNTIMVGHGEQNPFADNLLFVLPDVSRAVCTKWAERDDAAVFEGLHYGYQSRNSCVHKRSITYFPARRRWEIEDMLEGAGSVPVSFLIHCAPGISVRTGSSREIYLSGVREKAALIFSREVPVRVRPYHYSPSYGRSLAAECMVIEEQWQLPHKFAWVIQGGL
jgi:uncharacterized heparinase superfamily protein